MASKPNKSKPKLLPVEDVLSSDSSEQPISKKGKKVVDDSYEDSEED
jgi:hypothetical protein